MNAFDLETVLLGKVADWLAISIGHQEVSREVMC
jgi:hypothetical protein